MFLPAHFVSLLISDSSPLLLVTMQLNGLLLWLNVKNLPAVQEPQEMQVQSLGQEDPLEEGMATHSSILAWRIPLDRGAW